MCNACEQWCAWAQGFLPKGMQWWNFFRGPLSTYDMSGQQRLENTQPEQQQPDEEEDSDKEKDLIPPEAFQIFLNAFSLIFEVAFKAMIDDYAHCYIHTPYYTSSLSGAGWVEELLTGHPWYIQNELSVPQGIFIILIKALQLAGLWSSCHMSIEKQLAIFLYTAVTGMSCIHVGECFQWSSDTITKWVLWLSLVVSNKFPDVLNDFHQLLWCPPSTQHMCSSLIQIHPCLPRSEMNPSFTLFLIVL